MATPRRLWELATGMCVPTPPPLKKKRRFESNELL